MPSKNDLSALKVQSKSTLKNVRAPIQHTEKEKLTEIAWVRFTRSEYEAVKAKAGLVPVATYLRHLLLEHTDLF